MMLSLINYHIAILGFALDPTAAMEAAYAFGRRAVQLDGRNNMRIGRLASVAVDCTDWMKGSRHWNAQSNLIPTARSRMAASVQRRRVPGWSRTPSRTRKSRSGLNPRDPSIFFASRPCRRRITWLAISLRGDPWAERSIQRMPRWSWDISAAGGQPFRSRAIREGACRCRGLPCRVAGLHCFGCRALAARGPGEDAGIPSSTLRSAGFAAEPQT